MKGSILFFKREILMEDLDGFIRISKNNPLSKLAIVSSIFSFLLNKYLDNYQNIISLYPSDFINLENLTSLKLERKEKMTFKDLLQCVASEIKNAFSHTYYNTNALEIESSPKFSLQFGEEVDSEKSDVSLLYEEVDEKVLLTIFYVESYPGYVIENLLRNFYKIILNYKKLIDTYLDSFILIDEDEKNKLLVEFNDTKVDYPNDKTIADIFEEQVKKTPDNIAVTFENIQLTYEELNKCANQFARFLKDNHYIEPQQVVAALLPKSIDLIISFLAIEKLGSIYMPIDVNYPKERVDYIIKDSKAAFIISEEHIVQHLKINCPYTSLNLVELNSYSSNNLNISVRSHDLAYLIYTSGSTGSPKGVLVEHSSNINMSLDQIKKFNITSKDKVVWFASVAFDASISEIMMGLYSGAALCIPKEEQLKDETQFISFLKKTNSNIITLPPSYLELLDVNELEGVKTIITAGESANPRKAEIIVKKGINYFNAYGPTEFSVCATIFKLKDDESYKNIPIGRPISNTQVYVLDENLNPIPIGLRGNIYLAGVGLSRGYLNMSELTALKFVDNPFEKGKKMYDTGDMARWLPDGNIEFLGRKDFQVKIRGFRIELGEIETHLSQYKNIKQVVAEAKEVNGEKVLVAYYTRDIETPIDKTDLRHYLQSKLPEYMVPGFYVELENIPLTPNGKIDRGALPEVTEIDIIRKEYVAHRNEIEQALVEIWQEVLRIKKVGITDNFFELGGNSLMVAQILNRTYQRLSRNISFKDFFVDPTIKGMYQRLHKNAYVPIPKATEQESYPLTPSQQRLWVLSQLEGGSLAYNMLAVVLLKGRLEKKNFEESFLELIKKHEILRTVFRIDEQKREVRQYILPKEEVHFTIEVLNFLSKKEEDIECYLQKATNEIFDLENAPLIRVVLLRKKNEEYILSLSMHHIIGDGWSTEVLISEVVENYNQLCGKKGILSIPLRVQYKDYAVWLQKEIQGEKYKRAEKYWLNQFEREIPVLELPSYKPRPLVQTYNGNNISYLFSEAFTDKLRIVSEQHQTTLFMTLMAGINALLYRYTGQKDITIGTPVAGREHPELENQIGLYLNTLAIKTQLEEKNTFRSLLEKEKKVLLEAYEHQIYPFDELVGKLNLKRDTSRSAIFDVLVVLQNQSKLHLGKKKEDIQGLDIEEYDFKRKTSQFDMSFIFSEGGNQIGLRIEYNTDIYDEFLINRIFAHLDNLLSKAIENENTDIEDIDFLTKEERYQILEEFNDTKVGYPRDKTIIELFEEQVLKTPNNIAVVFKKKKLTYRELNKQANQLGGYLRQNYNIHPDDLIVIKVERDEKMIVAILGTLKSGAAYVPIDPEYPLERIKYIEQDTKAKVIIDKTFFEDFEKKQKNYLKTNLSRNNTSSDLAYVIYTSGTTGQPKGVMIEQKGIVNRLLWAQEYFKLDWKDAILQKTSFCFDVSVWELIWPLIAGARLVFAKPGGHKDAKYLREIIETYKITTIHFVPSMLKVFLDDIKKGECTDLIRVLCSGESLKVDQVALFQNKLSIAALYNLYGPTEAAIDVSCWRVPKRVDVTSVVPIGSPVSNTRLYILDRWGKIAPLGVSGEIYIGGAQVSRGYLNRQELTKKMFIPNPFKLGDRLYCTGDLGRWLPDGNIEFLCRVDNQIKIHGFRVEAGEIESLLQKSGFVRQSVVLAHEGKDGTKHLVGYVVPKKKIDKSIYQSYLSDKLPGYMVPSLWMELKSLPITPNGKIDRKALPKITYEAIIRKDYVAPRNKTEKRFVEVWQEVLGIEKVGIKDNFFELGGNSLNLHFIINKLNGRYNYIIKSSDFFTYLTIDNIVRRVTKKYTRIVNNQDKNSKELITLNIKQLRSRSAHLNNSLITIRNIFEIKNEDIENKRIISTIEKIIASNDIFGINYIIDKNITYINFHTPKDRNYSVEVMTDIDDSVINDLLNISFKSIYLYPLYKFFLIESNNSKFIVLLISHSIFDGLSWMILQDQFYTFLDKKELTDKKLSYKSYLRNDRVDHNIAKRRYWNQIMNNHFKFKIPSEKNCIIHKGNFISPQSVDLSFFITSLFFWIRTELNVSTFYLLYTTIGRSEKFMNTMGYFTNFLPIFLSFNSQSFGLTRNKIKQEVIKNAENEIDFENITISNPNSSFPFYLNFTYNNAPKPDIFLKGIQKEENNSKIVKSKYSIALYIELNKKDVNYEFIINTTYNNNICVDNFINICKQNA